MKRVIYSLYQPNIPKSGYSVNTYKQNQFERWKHKLEKCKQEYANKCNAEFIMHYPNLKDYTSLQFEKIRLLEQYAESYDEVLYLDFDIVPSYLARNMFECVDTSKISMHPFHREIKPYELKLAIDQPDLQVFDQQTMFVKICAKKSMLLLEGIDSNNLCYNTGVICANSEVIKTLQFTERLDEMCEILDESKEDSIYPDIISKYFSYNNEVFISYLIEKYQIPHNDIAMNWNYVIDDRKDISLGGYDFLHMVSKDFDILFDQQC